MNPTYHIGDATQPVGPGAKVIVHCCNDVGGWEKGFVLALSRRWSEPKRAYVAWYRRPTDQPFALGEVQFVPVAPGLVVANLIGQHGIATRQQRIVPVRYDALRTGLQRVAEFALENHASVHMPRIGCGLAGGTWDEVEPMIEDELCARGVEVHVYDLPESMN